MLCRLVLVLLKVVEKQLLFLLLSIFSGDLIGMVARFLDNKDSEI